MRLNKEIVERTSYLQDLRHLIHSNPETAFEEVATLRLIAERSRQCGYRGALRARKDRCCGNASRQGAVKSSGWITRRHRRSQYNRKDVPRIRFARPG